MTSSNDFIPLDRTFNELSTSAAKSDEVEISNIFTVESRLGWDAIFGFRRAVILSEAGSGKTKELLNATRRLRADGKRAFFLRLENIRDGLEDAFELGNQAEFDAWLASGDEAWLLLDSIDEARLRGPDDFKLAIKRLSRHINTARDRVRIVLTGRTHAWRPQTDYELCQQWLGLGPEARSAQAGPDIDGEPSGQAVSAVATKTSDAAEKDPNKFKIVTLHDLTEAQVRKFAAARGLTDVNDFLEAIERVEAWTFTARPQDLEDLIAYWQDTHKIGGRLELMKNSVARRLQERDQTRADVFPISAEQASSATQLIAAANTLTQELSIQVPDGAENRRGLPLREILPDWTNSRQSALLSLPIFDEEIYGVVRLHHRSVREFLTAKWFAKLLEGGASRRSIEILFFREQYGIEVVVPALRPILPWLVLFDERILAKVLVIAPEIVLEGGDPIALPPEVRTKLLREICQRMANEPYSIGSVDSGAVQRFAKEDIAPEIKKLFKKHAGNEEIIGFLLKMVWIGKLSALQAEARRYATAVNVREYTKVVGIRALRAIGAEDDLKKLRKKLLASTTKLKREWVAEILNGTEPEADIIAWLFAALSKTEQKSRYAVDHMNTSVNEFVERADVEALKLLIDGFHDLLKRPPFVEAAFCEVSKQHYKLVGPAAMAVERLVAQRHPYALCENSLDIVYWLRAVREFKSDYEEAKTALAQAIPSWPELNRAVFWNDTRIERKRIERKPGGRLTNFYEARHFGSYWVFKADDFGYAVSQIKERTLQDDRLVALSLAAALYQGNDRPESWRADMEHAVGDDAELKGQLRTLLEPPTQPNRWDVENSKWKRQQEAAERARAKEYARRQKFIREHVATIRNPGFKDPSAVSQTQWYLHEEIRKNNGHSDKWTSGNWQSLISSYGEDAARAYRDAAVNFWRRHKPRVQSEEPSNETSTAVIFGLTGLEIEAFETQGWAQGLSEEEVEIACRYAFHELNGFPRWFPRLFEAHPKVVAGHILREIEYELAIENGGQETHYVISDVAWTAQWTWTELGPHLLALLEIREPASIGNLNKLLHIIQGAASVPDGDVARIAAAKVASVPDDVRRAIWYAVWTGVQPNIAIPQLQAALGRLASADDRTAFSMTFVRTLDGENRGDAPGARSSYVTAEHLKTLYLLMHHHIRRADDIDRANTGVYSPGPRDEAQDARERLLNQLNSLTGKEPFIALQEIAEQHPNPDSRPHFARFARRMAERDADTKPWTPAEVRDFNDKLERTPRDHRELADLAVLRLLDLKDDYENGDESVANILVNVALETEMRNFIARDLRNKANGRYTIHQEEELADAKRPDLRFQGVGFDAPVPTELKLANDGWSGADLFERMENQLGGDYLRDSRSSRGIFALVRSGTKKRWTLPNGKRVDFDGLCTALRNHWLDISSDWPNVDDITVIGVDLTKRAD